MKDGKKVVSREKSMEEVREEFLNYIINMIDYLDGDNKKSTKEKLESLACSIFSALDGDITNLPSFVVAPLSGNEEKKYYISEGENFYPDNTDLNIKCDIAGVLHGVFCSKLGNSKNENNK